LHITNTLVYFSIPILFGVLQPLTIKKMSMRRNLFFVLSCLLCLRTPEYQILIKSTNHWGFNKTRMRRNHFFVLYLLECLEYQ